MPNSVVPSPQPLDPRTVFRYAESFTVAIELLKPQFEQGRKAIDLSGRITIADAGRFVPFATVDSFALELYLKCLMLMDRGEIKKVHGIKELFRELKLNTRQRIKNNYADRIASQLPRMSKALKRRDLLRFKNFRSYLERSNRAFENIRYFFERPTRSSPPSVYYSPDLRWAVRKSILDIMPEWAFCDESKVPTLLCPSDACPLKPKPQLVKGKNKPPLPP